MSNGTMVWTPGYQPSQRRFSLPNVNPFSQAKKQNTGMGSSWTGTGTTTKKRRPKGGKKKSFTRKVMDVFGAKHFTDQPSVVIPNVTPLTYNLTSKIVQGTSNSQREGDSVYLEALKIEGIIHSSVDSNAYKYRILVGYSGEEHTAAAWSSTGLTNAEIFLPGTFALAACGIVNPKAFTVLYDQVIDINSQITGEATLQSFRDTIQLKTKFPYQSAGAVYGKTKNLYVIVLGYGVALAVNDPTGTVFMSMDLIFKD